MIVGCSYKKESAGRVYSTWMICIAAPASQVCNNRISIWAVILDRMSRYLSDISRLRALNSQSSEISKTSKPRNRTSDLCVPIQTAIDARHPARCSQSFTQDTSPNIQRPILATTSIIKLQKQAYYILLNIMNITI